MGVSKQEDVLLYMTEKWRSAIDAGKSVGVIFIDFKKIFDSVSHPVLLKKLNACGISGQFHQYIESYLENRSQFTVINRVSSKEEYVDFGVPKGSLLGPPCFSINVNDMNDHTSCNLDLFADDSTAHSVQNTVDEAFVDLQNNASEIANYSLKNSLTIHPEKCEILTITKKAFIGPLPAVTLDGKQIKVVQHSKCLGVTMRRMLPGPSVRQIYS